MLSKLIYLSNKHSSADTFSYIKKYIKPSDKVLDYGTGEGYVAKEVQDYGCVVEKIDIENFTYDKCLVTIFDGFNAPFADKTFDVSLCTFVFHHSSDHEKILKELGRLTKGNIIICEDLPETLFDEFLTWIHRNYSKLWYHSGKMLFRSDAQWKKFFKEHGFDLVAEEEISRIKRNISYPVRRKVYVVRAS